MGVYEDMANDAGCPYGTDDNKYMAAMIEEQEYRATMESQYHDEMEEQYQHHMEEERRREILFRKFTETDNKSLHEDGVKPCDFCDSDIKSCTNGDPCTFLDKPRP